MMQNNFYYSTNTCNNSNLYMSHTNICNKPKTNICNKPNTPICDKQLVNQLYHRININDPTVGSEIENLLTKLMLNPLYICDPLYTVLIILADNLIIKNKYNKVSVELIYMQNEIKNLQNEIKNITLKLNLMIKNIKCMYIKINYNKKVICDFYKRIINNDITVIDDINVMINNLMLHPHCNNSLYLNLQLLLKIINLQNLYTITNNELIEYKEKIKNEIDIVSDFFERIKNEDPTVIHDINNLLLNIMKDPSYANNPLYIDLTILLQTIDYQYLYNDINSRLLSLQEKLAEAENNICQKTQHYRQFAVNTIQKTVIKIEYLHYIQQYGFPDDGVFLPTLLDKIIQENQNKINKPNDCDDNDTTEPNIPDNCDDNDTTEPNIHDNCDNNDICDICDICDDNDTTESTIPDNCDNNDICDICDNCDNNDTTEPNIPDICDNNDNCNNCDNNEPNIPNNCDNNDTNEPNIPNNYDNCNNCDNNEPNIPNNYDNCDNNDTNEPNIPNNYDNCDNNDTNEPNEPNIPNIYDNCNNCDNNEPNIPNNCNNNDTNEPNIHNNYDNYNNCNNINTDEPNNWYYIISDNNNNIEPNTPNNCDNSNTTKSKYIK
jgi:hypothetical protein